MKVEQIDDGLQFTAANDKEIALLVDLATTVDASGRALARPAQQEEETWKVR